LDKSGFGETFFVIKEITFELVRVKFGDRGGIENMCEVV